MYSVPHANNLDYLRCVLLAAVYYDMICKGARYCPMHFYRYYLLIKVILWGIYYFYLYIMDKKLKSRKPKKLMTHR